MLREAIRILQEEQDVSQKDISDGVSREFLSSIVGSELGSSMADILYLWLRKKYVLI